MLTEVSKEEFYKFIGPLDVTLDVQGEHPYTTIFKLRYGSEKGKTIDSYAENTRRIITKYFITH